MAAMGMLFTGVCVVGVAGLAGCSVAPRSFPLGVDAGQDATILVVRGDWNDVRVSVEHGIDAGQLTLLTRDDDLRAIRPTQTFSLLGIDDTPGEVIATWTDGPPLPETGERDPKSLLAERRELATIELRVRIGEPGHWRDQPRERQVLHAIAKRLRQLAGVKTAPLDAPERS